MAEHEIPTIEPEVAEKKEELLPPPKKPVKATVKKKSFGRKVAEALVPEDIPDIKSYIIYDVVIPTVKDTIITGIEMLLFGEASSRRRRKNGTISDKYVAYDRPDERRKRKPSNRSTFLDEPIAYDTKSDAIEVLESMKEILRDYNRVSIADMYRESGLASDNRRNSAWGWTDLREARIVNDGGDWIIELPKPYPIE